MTKKEGGAKENQEPAAGLAEEEKADYRKTVEGFTSEQLIIHLAEVEDSLDEMRRGEMESPDLSAEGVMSKALSGMEDKVSILREEYRKRKAANKAEKK
jgi:hypothetical protein